MSVETINSNQFMNMNSEENMNEILTLTLPPPETFEEPIMNEKLMPPAAPPTFQPGKFKYLKTKQEREMLQSAYQAINILELWDFLKQPSESFMFSDDKRVSLIYNKIEELGYWGHSGFTFGWTMRAMQHIAREGEEEYMKTYLNID
jgi:hypothetical protein